MDEDEPTVVRPLAGPRSRPLPVSEDPDATVVRPSAADVTQRYVRRREDDPDATVIVGQGPMEPLLPAPRQLPIALQAGFTLLEYRIDRVLGQGGFGITYLATDVNLNAKVAIKEYLPEEIAFRAGDRSISPNASRHAGRYREGLENFLVEARTLAAFRHPAIVRVARFFEAHRTAYMVLEFEQGEPFKTWWPKHSNIGESGLVELLLPLLDGLQAVHAAGFLHRDIKPDNIQVRVSDGSLVLLDFGSAGQTVALADQGAAVVTPGYAPIEQYGLGEQGPWTDVYALGATLYWAVVGKKPPDAETRAANPAAFVPAIEAGAGRCGRAFLEAIDWALDPDPTARPRDVAEFRHALAADHVSSLRLADALQREDTVIEGDEGTPSTLAGMPRRRRRHRSLKRGARTLLAPRHWPLAVKLTLLLVATALLPMLAAGLWNLRGGADALARAELANVEHVARTTALRVGQFIDDGRHVARGLASDDVFAEFLTRPDETQALLQRARLQRIVRADPDVQLIIVMDMKGNAVVSSDPEVMGRNFAFRRYFREASAGRSFTSGIVVGAVAGATGIFYAEPLKDTEGRIVGVLVLRLLGSSVARIVDDVREDAALTPLLVDGDGVVVHHHDPARLFKSLVPLEPAQQAAMREEQRFRRERIDSLDEYELARALQGARATGNVSYRSAVSGEQEIAGFAPVPGHDWIVAVSQPRREFEAPMRELWQQLLLTTVLVGLLFTGLALRFARGIVQPVRRLTEAANALKAGEFDAARVSVTSRDEMGQLGRTFNVMIDVLRQREREQRRGGKGGT